MTPAYAVTLLAALTIGWCGMRAVLASRRIDRRHLAEYLPEVGRQRADDL